MVCVRACVCSTTTRQDIQLFETVFIWDMFVCVCVCVCTVRLSGKAYSSLKLRLGENFSFVFHAVKVLNMKTKGPFNRFFSEHSALLEGRAPRCSGRTRKAKRRNWFVPDAFHFNLGDVLQNLK